MNRTIDVLLYVDRLDVYRVDELDRQVVQAITQTFGKEIWCKTLLVLTHAQFSPPDDLSYETFSSKRSDSLLRTIRAGSKMGKQQFEVLWLYSIITMFGKRIRVIMLLLACRILQLRLCMRRTVGDAARMTRKKRFV